MAKQRIQRRIAETPVDGPTNEQITSAGLAAFREITDLAAFPVLTEEVGYPPSPLARPSGAPGMPGTALLSQIIAGALNDVLGWKTKADDPKGFVGALNASFALTQVEGHTEATWTPRTYAVQTDLAGGITGAQASLYSRGQKTLEASLPLLDGLYPLDVQSDPQDVAALKAIIRCQLTELIAELGIPGGPRVSRVDQYFQLLFVDPDIMPKSGSLETTEPDEVKGTLGTLRDELGLTGKQDLVNTVEEEENLSNFRILSDYVTSLAQSWINNRDFFTRQATPFFGTQLILLSRQLSVVAESVDEVRFTLDSVFIGPAERQTIQLPSEPPMFLEELLVWLQHFAAEEAPRVIQDGGKFGVERSFLPVATNLRNIVRQVRNPMKNFILPLDNDNNVDNIKVQIQEIAAIAKLNDVNVIRIFATHNSQAVKDIMASSIPIANIHNVDVNVSDLPIPTTETNVVEILLPIPPALPPGFRTARVQRALQELQIQLDELVNLATPITHKIIVEKDELVIVQNDLKTVRAEVDALSTTVQASPNTVLAIPSTLQFGEQAVGTISALQIITIINFSKDTVTFASVNPSGGDTNDFVVTKIEGHSTLENLDQLSIKVVFSPTIPGDRTANFNLTINDSINNSILKKLTFSGIGIPDEDSDSDARE